ncbi:MAG TPA: hypothetical protein PLN52_19180 [Opitutaceae bacterium]|nr:hypothetical protein [Opitutaceae bacterium]
MKIIRTLVGACAAAWGTGLVGAWLQATEIELPPDTARFEVADLPGYSAALTHCMTCHSVEYTRSQPPSPRTYWKATVIKMQKTFGAPIPDADVESIVDYLAKTYGTERMKSETSAANQKS